MGQSGAPLVLALGAAGGCEAVQSGPYPDCRLAEDTRSAARADQITGLPRGCSDAYQRLRSAGNENSAQSGALAHRGRGEDRRASRRSPVVVLSTLRLLGRPIHGIRRRDSSRPRRRIPNTCPEAEGGSPNDRASHDGRCSAVSRRTRRCEGAF